MMRPHGDYGANRLSGGFVAIIAFKYFKAIVFVLVGLAALHLARLPAMPTVVDLAHFFRVSPENEIIRRLAHVIREITPGQAIGFGVVSLFVGAVFGTEATLLACRVWWSTYFTIVLTAMGLPLEIYEIFQRPGSVRRYLLLAVNAAILVYLWKRRNEFRGRTKR
jgi:uncharacterized membrane protein (DUF2068 family)